LTVALAGSADAQAAAPVNSGPHPLKHVWIIELENAGYQQSLGNPVADPFLAKTLVRLGALLKNYCDWP
jgi:hypothetical protein